MSRFLTAALAGAAVFLSSAPAAVPAANAEDCFTITDPAKDAVAFSDPSGVSYDADLDIVGVAFDATGGNVTVKVKVAKLASSSSYFLGDEFTARFTVNSKYVELAAQRDDISSGQPPGSGVTKAYNYIYVDTVKKAGAVAATHDKATNTVTITVPIADLATATGTVVGTGTVLRNLSVVAGGLLKPDSAARGGRVFLDTATAPYGKWHVVGSACDGAAVPLVFDAPKAGCTTIEDKKGDANAFHAQAPSDPAVDIVSLAVQTTPTELRATMKVDKLAAMPARGNGLGFDLHFKFGARYFAVGTGTRDAVITQTNADPNRNASGTAANPTAASNGYSGFARMDVATSTVYFVVDRASLEEMIGEKLTSTSDLTEFGGKSYVLTPGLIWTVDRAPDTIGAEATYRVGDNRCFKTMSALTVSPVSVQYGDRATVTAKLTDGAKPIAGKAVKFAVGAASVTATTDANGVARGLLGVPASAGAQTMTVSYAGDATYDESSVTVPYTVVVEKTRMTLSVAKKGTSRTVTATLKDDDGTALRGVKINWYINGKKVATATTSTAGQAVLKTAKPTQTVVAEFLGVSGKYAASKATTRV